MFNCILSSTTMIVAIFASLSIYYAIVTVLFWSRRRIEIEITDWCAFRKRKRAIHLIDCMYANAIAVCVCDSSRKPEPMWWWIDGNCAISIAQLKIEIHSHDSSSAHATIFDAFIEVRWSMRISIFIEANAQMAKYHGIEWMNSRCKR